MSMFVFPAVIALTIKLMVIFIYRRNLQGNSYFTMLVLIFACHNFCEVLVFWEYFRGIKAEYLVRSYYVISLFALFAIATHAANVSLLKEKLFATILLPVICLISLMLMLTDLVVSGVESWGYVVTAVRGDLYNVFQVMALLLTAQIVYLLYKGYKNADSHTSQIRCAYSAIALTPLVLAVLLVILLMNLGFHINAVVFFPVATTLFLVITLASEEKHRLTDIRRFIPFSDERRTSNQIMDIFSSYAQDQANYRDSITQIEKLLVEHKYEKNNRNATYAAERMGMPRSSLYSLFNRLGVDKDNSSQ